MIRLVAWLVRFAGAALAVWLSTIFVWDISVRAESIGGTIGTLALVALIFGVVNAVIKPVVKLLGCGLYVLTIGLFALVVNGALLLLTALIAGWLDIPFYVDSFFPGAVVGALFIGLVTWALNSVSDKIIKD